MNKILYNEIIYSLIELIDNSNIGSEQLEGYIDSDNIHKTWEDFKEYHEKISDYE